MDINYFSIYDKKAELFGQAFPSHTPGSAERSLKESMANPDSPHGKFPDDFALYQLFVLDDSSGIITQKFEPPRLIVEASSLSS